MRYRRTNDKIITHIEDMVQEKLQEDSAKAYKQLTEEEMDAMWHQAVEEEKEYWQYVAENELP